MNKNHTKLMHLIYEIYTNIKNIYLIFFYFSSHEKTFLLKIIILTQIADVFKHYPTAKLKELF